MRVLRRVSLFLGILAVLPLMAHVLELPNKLALDGPLWLAVQQHLYRGWGPFLGAPAEIGGLLTALALAFARRRSRPLRRLSLLAAAAYAAMLAIFFVFNAPVNAALNQWTAATLPADWPAWRLRWETGHALAALAAVIALAALLLAGRLEDAGAGDRRAGSGLRGAA